MPYDPAVPSAKKPDDPASVTVFIQMARRRWSATMNTATGPITGVGDSQGEAQRQLDELITMRSAV